MPLSRRHLLTNDLVLSGTGVLAACSSQASSPLTIGLIYTPNIQFTPFYIAKKGSKHASGVNLRHYGAQGGLFDVLLSGKGQLVVAGADEAIIAASSGSGLVVVGGYCQSYPACLIVPEGSTIKAPADLKDKTVGTLGRKGETWYALQLAIDTTPLSESNLTIQDIGYTQQAALVGSKAGTVIGFSNNDAVQIKQAGTAMRMIQPAESIPLIGVSLVTTRELLDSRRQDLQAAVKASVKGMTAFVKDPDAAAEATKEHVQNLVDSTQTANAREVTVVTGKLVSREDKAAVDSVRVDDFIPMIEFLTLHKILGDKKTSKAADVCAPLGQ